jgi:hypothetical protein
MRNPPADRDQRDSAPRGHDVLPKGVSPNIWIAEDPTLPGTAFAFHSADDHCRHQVAASLREWQDNYGVSGRLINKQDGARMLNSWDRNKSTLKPQRCLNDILLWPDGTHCFAYDMNEMSHMSDDFERLPYLSPRWQEIAGEKRKCSHLSIPAPLHPGHKDSHE